jgi:hypothetical protein
MTVTVGKLWANCGHGTALSFRQAVARLLAGGHAPGFTVTPAGLRLLQDLRRQLLQPPTPLHPPARPATEQPETVDAIA